jgi:hypothetical protein
MRSKGAEKASRRHESPAPQARRPPPRLTPRGARGRRSCKAPGGCCASTGSLSSPRKSRRASCRGGRRRPKPCSTGSQTSATGRRPDRAPRRGQRAHRTPPSLLAQAGRGGAGRLRGACACARRCFGCGTSFETGFRFGLPIPFAQWTKNLASLKFEHRGANHGQWDDIVCVSKMASGVFD